MNVSRRESLQSAKPSPTTHAGLWLDRFVETVKRHEGGSGDGETSKTRLVNEVCGIIPGDDYVAAFKRWKAALECAGAKVRTATVKGRLAVGLGADGVLETSISLHRTWGVPVIPGSGLKGATAAFARTRLDPDEWGQSTEAFVSVFGTQSQAGSVTFFDALWVPGTGHEKRPLHPDVMTVHHRDYYGGKDAPPADWDSPVPVSFVTATGSFLVALAGPDEAVAAAFDILELALEHAGVGAKTSSGYGRMTLERPPRDPDQLGADTLIDEIEALFTQNRYVQEMGQKLPRWRELGDRARRRVSERVVELVEAIKDKDNRKNARKKPWYVEMTDGLDETP